METRAAREQARRARIELYLPMHASKRQYVELGAFVRFCVTRLERELGELERWIVKIDLEDGRFQSTIIVDAGSVALRATGSGLDGTLAVWDALAHLEQDLREARARRAVHA